MSDLFAAVVSIAPTRRRRWLWAAWWTAPPARAPFRQPDAAEGGAVSRAEALRAAEVAAGRPLVQIEGSFARAYARILTGQPPWPEKESADPDRAVVRPASAAPTSSIWQVLGVEPRAPIEEIRRAFLRRARSLHPDHGGEAAAFRDLRQAYEEALQRRARGERRPRKKR